MNVVCRETNIVKDLATTAVSKINVMCVVAVRPNFMKAKPVVDQLEKLGIRVTIVHTGQHHDWIMSDVFFEEIGLREPDFHLGVGSGSHAQQVGNVMIAFEDLLSECRPDLVLVLGDVNSTAACAIAAAKCHIPVGHVEAGLRSRDWVMPEEVNRVIADAVSSIFFATSEDAVDNLKSEGVEQSRIVLAGNVMIDTLRANLERSRNRPILDELELTTSSFGLVTLHRQENVEDPERFEELLNGLNLIADLLPLIFPAHPRIAQKIKQANLNPRIRITQPLGYLDFLCLQANSRLVLTDSGGIQEETTALGIPCLTLRENTERPITISAGTNQLVGTDPNKMVETVREVLKNGVEARCPELWDGFAGERIARAILSAFESKTLRFPTELSP